MPPIVRGVGDRLWRTMHPRRCAPVVMAAGRRQSVDARRGLARAPALRSPAAAGPGGFAAATAPARALPLGSKGVADAAASGGGKNTAAAALEEAAARAQSMALWYRQQSRYSVVVGLIVGGTVVGGALYYYLGSPEKVARFHSRRTLSR